MSVRLSSPVEDLRHHYDVVVVGSGYGGAIAAARLARAGRQVCVLERGKEMRPGEYPDTGAEAWAETQIDYPSGHFGDRTALYDMRVNDDLSVFVGCGLGGTSLVNANVSLRADERVFADSRWPAQLRADLHGGVEEGYRRAEEMLRPTPTPDTVPPLKKTQALAESATVLPGRFGRVPINVTFADQVSPAGVEQKACTLCGDCVSGCNVGAKNTVLMNYLPDARNHGAEIFTQVAVRSLERTADGWLVHYQLLDVGRERFEAPSLFLSTNIVVLGAGTLGSTEILLRSAAHGLPVSAHTGHRITGNGDVLAFSYNSDREVQGVGWGHRDKGRLDPIGPCITGIIDMRDHPDLDRGMVIEEGAVPGALSTHLAHALAAAAKAVGVDTDPGLRDHVREKTRELDSLLRGAYRGAVRNTQTYLVMAHDDGEGSAVLEDDRLRIRWPGVGGQPTFQQISETLQRATEPLGGTYVRSPLWTGVLGHRLVTVHPLGGCAMAETAERGVVNHKGQVFRGPHGDEVYDSLYVVDGAVIPRSLGVNPLLTISALAERSCALLAADRGWTIDYSLPSSPTAADRPEVPGIRFTETMKGYVSTEVTHGFQAAEARGRSDNSPFSFTLTIVSEDLDAMLTDPERSARMLGTVSAPALSSDPITVTEGTFNLFVNNPGTVRGRQMRYRMRLTTREGKHYYFSGFKSIRDDRGLDLWSDTTTLYVTVFDGDSDTGPVVAKGVLTISPQDFLLQLTTLEVLGAASVAQRLEATARFGRFFAGSLFDVYGSVVPRISRFDSTVPPRKKRPLRVPTPELYPVHTDDGVELLLTRYSGGPKGPVILSHGLGTSSQIYSIDTVETNLLEFLCAHDYDVWLLDLRSSIALPTSPARVTGDDIARYDYPAAVAKVRVVSGSPSVQVVAHCFGSTTLFMSMLAGLEGVRSVIASQVATHLVCPPTTRVKSRLFLARLLRKIGVTSLTAYTDTSAGWFDRLYDRLLATVPREREERCDSPVCRRITFLYSRLYEHAQLDRATHDVLHEMYGAVSVTALDHLSRMVRAGRIRTADGRNTYLPQADRLAVPITLVHGAENSCFLPASTEKTLDFLARSNGPELYRRHVVPGYGHSDCIFGRRASIDVFPLIVEHLERTGQGGADQRETRRREPRDGQTDILGSVLPGQ